MIERVEEFACPECGHLNYVHWAKDENERLIPCLACYWEEWISEGKDPIPDQKKGQVFTRFEQRKVEHGAKFLVIKGKGKSIERDEETHREI